MFSVIALELLSGFQDYDLVLERSTKVLWSKIYGELDSFKVSVFLKLLEWEEKFVFLSSLARAP